MNMTTIDFVLTVPAIWSDLAKKSLFSHSQFYSLDAVAISIANDNFMDQKLKTPRGWRGLGMNMAWKYCRSQRLLRYIRSNTQAIHPPSSG
jgi:hypothetical protein